MRSLSGGIVVRLWLAVVSAVACMVGLPGTGLAQNDDRVEWLLKQAVEAHIDNKLLLESLFLDRAWSLSGGRWEVGCRAGRARLAVGRTQDAAPLLAYCVETAPEIVHKGEVAQYAELFADVKKKLADVREKLADVVVDLKPQEASLFVDDFPAALSPIRSDVWVTPGSHTFRAEHPGYVTGTWTIDVPKGETRSVSFKLKPVSAPAAPPEKAPVSEPVGPRKTAPMSAPTAPPEKAPGAGMQAAGAVGAPAGRVSYGTAYYALFWVNTGLMGFATTIGTYETLLANDYAEQTEWIASSRKFSAGAKACPSLAECGPASETERMRVSKTQQAGVMFVSAGLFAAIAVVCLVQGKRLAGKSPLQARAWPRVVLGSKELATLGAW